MSEFSSIDWWKPLETCGLDKTLLFASKQLISMLVGDGERNSVVSKGTY